MFVSLERFPPCIMYLKNIELQGFKSFADKTKVTFDKGVTVVVGPNGSGKSNITESLRWALGESSAKSLRGGKMPDVIFAGTENRKPLNYAEVVVTLDNSDHFISDAKDEIRVERHIYRNGDSEYLIDGCKVRLRDIHELFLDTGLGRDSFSIISQGRVEEIFNSKPEERRAIFEEAAGVLKYKTRKKETQSKLNQTQDNMDRLEDIIYELDNQMKPLEKQAKIAKEFLALEDVRKQLQLDILVDDIASHQADLTDLNQSLESVQTNLSDYYERKQKLERHNQELKNRRHHLSEKIARNQQGLVDLTRVVADLERQIDLITLESSQTEEKRVATNQKLEELTVHRDNLKSELLAKEKHLTVLDEKLKICRQNITDLQENLERFSTNPEQLIEQLREDFVSLMQKEADLSNQLTLLDADIDSQQQLSQDKSKELQETSDTMENLRQSAQKALEDFESAKATVAELLEAYQSLAKQTSQDEIVYREEQQKLFDHLDVMKSKQARKSSLESILKNHSNFYAGVKAVLQASQQIGGIVGAVSEHLTFNRDYQTALEIALGASSQHIIVEDEAAAKRSIAHLKKHRQGRGTFLPLTTIKPRQLSSQNYEKLASTPGFLGIASDLIRYDQRLSNIFKNLLGVTAIFDTIDNANQAARALHYQVRLVTLDGTELRPGGAFAGGTNRQNNTTFIKPELDSLTAELEELKKVQMKREQSLQKCQEKLKEGKAELEKLKQQGEDARLAEQKSDLAYQQLSDRLSDVTQLYTSLKNSQPEVLSDHLQGQKEELQAALRQLATEKTALTDQINQIKDDRDSIDQKVSQLTENLSQEKLTERDLISERKFEDTDKKRLENSLEQVCSDIRSLEQLLEQHANQMDAQRLPKIKEQHQEVSQRKEEEEQMLVRLRFDLEDCEANLEELAETITKETQKNEDLIRQQAQIESKITTVSDRLRNFAHHLSEEYQMSLEDAQQVAKDVPDLVQARQQLQELQRQIKALGPVNLDAIEQYDEVSQRLEFLNGQKTDLVHAKNLLMETINDMDDEVKSRFRVTFEAIRESFQLTFKQMFGGGSADLYLTDNDVLIAGVEMSVQPPGKKIQSLNLMSGGEKALSALALLFAIIRVKTIPFVILDEVEAALDEANVKRFGDYLNRFDKSSQFIVVTHRKGTMAAADSIYGVTMQESGVSKVVSVKLKDAEKMIQ